MQRLSITPSITNRDAIKYYLKDISKIPLLSVEEEKELGRLAKQGDKKAQDKLVISNLRFVISVAKQYQHQGLPLDELISAGNLGLMHAATKFDVDRGFKFISYAVWWIRQSILKALYSTSRTIRLPLNQINNVSKILKAIKDFEQKYERTPTTKELEALTELSEDKISKLIEYSKYTVSIDTPFSDDEEAGTLVDIIPNHNSTNTDEALIKESNTNQILSILNLLRDREHDILRLYYGINVRQMNMEEIGELFGISAERVRQIKKKALDMLREDCSKELSNILYGTA
jgi:RNA polymerase primary sigma factor